jgi:hypothetical protein
MYTYKVITLCLDYLIGIHFMPYIAQEVSKMENEKWNNKIAHVQAWIDENRKSKDDMVQETITDATNYISRGNKRVEMREHYWKQMLATFKHIDDAPIGGKPQTTLTPDQTKVLNGLQGDIEEWFANALTTFKRTKGEDKTITSFTDVSKVESARRVSALKRMIKSDDWDGSLEGLRAFQEGDE